MKSFIVFALVVIIEALAAPQGNPESEAVVLRFDNDNIGVDGYAFNLETSNGIAQSEQGALKNIGTENEALSVTGQYSYTAPDGQVYTVVYIADENGFQPQGAHLPVAPQV